MRYEWSHADAVDPARSEEAIRQMWERAMSEPSVRPLNDKVIVRPDEPERARGCILLPDAAQEPSRRGVVVAVGPGKLSQDGERRLPMPVKPGDRVLYGWGVAGDIEIDGEKLAIMNADTIQAILE